MAQNPGELPNIIGRKSKHPLFLYIVLNFVFPPLAYFLLWKHHAPLKPLARFTLINSFIFICYFVPALYSFVVAISALTHKNILNNQQLLGETILFTILGLLVTSSGITSSELARRKTIKNAQEKKRFLMILYGVLLLQYILGSSILLYMGKTAGTMRLDLWMIHRKF